MIERKNSCEELAGSLSQSRDRFEDEFYGVKQRRNTLVNRKC